jgi:sulfofructose kinase
LSILDKKIRIVGFGLTVHDHLLLLDHFPEADSKSEALQGTVRVGGPVANAIITCAKLGESSGLISVLGDDREGNFIREELKKHNVDTRGVIQDSNIRTPAASIWIDSKHKTRTVVLDNTRHRALEMTDIPIALIESAQICLTDGRYFQANKFALTAARKANGQVIIDAGSKREGIDEILPLVDYIICSESFSRNYTGQTNPVDAIRIIANRFGKKVVISLGVRGLIAQDNNELYKMPSYPTRVLDTTGAGDVFHGAFAFSLLNLGANPSFHRCLRFASIAAALSCQQLGGNGCSESFSEIMQRLSTWVNYF